MGRAGLSPRKVLGTAGGPRPGPAPEPTSLILCAVLLGQGELSLDSILQVLLLLAQHLLGLPQADQGLLRAGSRSALRRASPLKELAQLAHGCGVGGAPGRQAGEMVPGSPGPHLDGGAPGNQQVVVGTGDTLSWAFPGAGAPPSGRRGGEGAGDGRGRRRRRESGQRRAGSAELRRDCSAVAASARWGRTPGRTASSGTLRGGQTEAPGVQGLEVCARVRAQISVLYQ